MPASLLVTLVVGSIAAPHGGGGAPVAPAAGRAPVPVVRRVPADEPQAPPADEPASTDAARAEGGTSLRVRLAGDVSGLAGRLADEGFDVLPTPAAPAGPGASAGGGGAIELVVTPGELEELRRRGLAPEVIDRGRPLRERVATVSAATAGLAGYPDLAAVEARLLALQAAHPGLAAVVDLTARYGTPPTAEGRPLLGVRLSDHPRLDEDEPALLIVGGQHAREVVTPVVALDVAARLLDGYGHDPALTALLDEHEVWIAPVWNPDGYHHVFTADDLWRKNRRVLAGGIGVDLNRNYPVGWSAACGGSTSVSSATYKGPAPASEAETLTMLAFADDRHVAKVLDLHAFAGEWRFGYGCWSHPLEAFLAGEAAAYAALSGYAPASSCCLGGNIHWQGASRGALSLLVEAGSSFHPPYEHALAEADALWPAIAAFLLRPIPLSGHVRDACSGAPLPATLSVAELPAVNGEVLGSASASGRFHAFLPPGRFTLTVHAPGHAPHTQLVDVPAQGGVTLDVALAPDAGTGCFTNLGGGTSGLHGAPHLTGAGALHPGASVVLALHHGPPAALGLLFVAAQSEPVPFLGGTLHAHPWAAEVLLVTDAGGSFLAGTTWPAGLPPGLFVWLQAALADADQPGSGAVLSNGVRAVAP